MVDSDLDKARRMWGEELLFERESALQEKELKISQLEYEVRDIKEKARVLAQQNALFKQQYPFTAYASEMTDLKMIIDKQNQRYDGVEGLQQFRIDTNNQLRQQLGNAEDYINELYRLNPGMCLPNGKRFESDVDA